MTMIPFPFTPAAQPLREVLAWQTDLLRSRTGAEQRRALRLAPRIEHTASFVLQGPLRTRLDLLVHAAGAADLALPIWLDAQPLAAPLAAGASFVPCDTADRDFAGAALVVTGRGAQCELLDVDTVAPGGLTLAAPTADAWPAGALLYPVRRARLVAQPSLTRRLADVAEFAASFAIVEPCDWPGAMPLETYLGYPVLDRCLWIAQDLTQSYERILYLLDNGVGIPQVTDGAGRGFGLRQVGLRTTSRADRAALRALLYALRGRQSALWLPTKTDDLYATAISGTSLTVHACGYATHGLANPDKQHIRIELHSGAPLCRRITAAVDAGATEVLTLDSAVGVSPQDIVRICFLSLARLADDVVELQHQRLAGGEYFTGAQLMLRSVRHDLEAAP